MNHKLKSGTKEWADSNVNIAYGCSHDCRYCYAKKMAIRFKRTTKESWKNMEINQKNIERSYKKRSGRVMFPSSHDLTPMILNETIIVLNKLLDSNNHVLITSKPHFEVIKKIVDTFKNKKDNLQFRFTIGSIDDDILKYWEPGAPNFEERFKSLKYSYNNKFKTSISIEPFLDYNPKKLVKYLQPFVTESIWIGKMNYIPRNGMSENEKKHLETIRRNYEKNHILEIYHDLNDNPIIQWKDSIKKILIKNGINLHNTNF